MPIKFRCPNEGCGKALTVSDGVAGRAGKCPGCGGPLVVPHPEVVAEEIPYELHPEPMPEPIPARKPEPALTRPVDDPEWAPIAAKGLDGPVISFDAIGLAWGLLTQRMGTWILAIIVVTLAQIGCQIAVTIVSSLAGAAEMSLFGTPFPISSLVLVVVNAIVQTALGAGLYKLALKQIDGGEIGVGDVFAIRSVAINFGLMGLFTALMIVFGSVFLIIPGLVFAGLTLFAGPAVIDGLGAIEAIKRSVGTLGRQWFTATVFTVVMGMIVMVGWLALGVGLLFTVPLFILTISVQYRRSFAPGAVLRKMAVADPWAEAVGQPPRATGSRGVPGWAWGVLGVGLILPMAMFLVLAALLLPAIQKARQVALDRGRMEGARVETKGQVGGFQGNIPQPGGFSPMNPTNVSGPGVDRVVQALDRSKKRTDGRPFDLATLASLPPDDQHRAMVVAALVPLLRDRIADEDAAQALVAWAGPGDVPKLVAGLDSKTPRVRWLMFDKLRRLKAESAIPTLIERLAVPEDRTQASSALQAIGPKAIPAIAKVVSSNDRDTRSEAVTLLRRIAGGDRSMMLAVNLAVLKSPDVQDRRFAIGELNRIPVVESSRDDVLAVVGPLLKDADAGIRQEALKAIGAWGMDDRFSPNLIEMLDDPDRKVKIAAMAGLRKTPSPQAALAITKLLPTKENIIRSKAVETLVAMKIKDDEVEAEVLKLLDGTDSRLKEPACQVLQAIGTQASVPSLKKAAGSTNKNLAKVALAALNAIDPSATPDAPADSPKTKMAPRKKR